MDSHIVSLFGQNSHENKKHPLIVSDGQTASIVKTLPAMPGDKNLSFSNKLV